MTTFIYENSSGQLVNWPKHAFSKDDLRQLEQFLGTKNVIPLADLFAGFDGGDGCVAMRHDVDHSIQHALKFAAWEHARGIRSTYFILHSAWYYKDFKNTLNMAKSIESMGHEIGFHNDSIGEAIRTCKSENNFKVGMAADIIYENIDLWAKHDFTLRGCADHGGGYPEWQAQFWQKYRPEDFGFWYEAYQLMAVNPTNYISDNRGTWRAPLQEVEGKQTFMLTHPCHWPV